MINKVTIPYHTISYRGYRRLQGVTKGYKGLKGGYRGLQGLTRGYKGLQRLTGGYKGCWGLQGVMAWYGMVTLSIHGISFRYTYIQV